MACSALSIELAGFRVVRGEGFWWKSSFSFLFSASVCVSLLPLVVTRTWSFGAAEEQCAEWTVKRLSILELEGNGVGDIEDSVARQLFPAHLYNVTSLFVSVLCFLFWYTTKQFDRVVAEDLDRTLGSYYALEVLANLLVAVASLGTNCAPSGAINDLAFAVNLIASFGFSVIGTNIMCHRFLLEKARVVINVLNNANDADAWMAMLETSFKWEARSFLFVVVGVPLHFIYEPAAKGVLLVGAIFVIVMDTHISFSVTALFLRPIFKVLRRENSVHHSAGRISMLNTKWMTLFGSTFAVISSTGLYINLVLFALSGLGDPLFTNPHLSPYVTGINADSIVNNLSMILVSGVLKTLPYGALKRPFLVATSPHPTTHA